MMIRKTLLLTLGVVGSNLHGMETRRTSLIMPLDILALCARLSVDDVTLQNYIIARMREIPTAPGGTIYYTMRSAISDQNTLPPMLQRANSAGAVVSLHDTRAEVAQINLLGARFRRGNSICALSKADLGKLSSVYFELGRHELTSPPPPSLSSAATAQVPHNNLAQQNTAAAASAANPGRATAATRIRPVQHGSSRPLKTTESYLKLLADVIRVTGQHSMALLGTSEQDLQRMLVQHQQRNAAAAAAYRVDLSDLGFNSRA